MEDCRIVNDIVVRERGNETEMMCLILYTSMSTSTAIPYDGMIVHMPTTTFVLSSQAS